MAEAGSDDGAVAARADHQVLGVDDDRAGLDDLDLPAEALRDG